MSRYARSQRGHFKGMLFPRVKKHYVIQSQFTTGALFHNHNFFDLKNLTDLKHSVFIVSDTTGNLKPS